MYSEDMETGAPGSLEPSIKSGALSAKQHERAGDGSPCSSEFKDVGGVNLVVSEGMVE